MPGLAAGHLFYGEDSGQGESQTSRNRCTSPAIRDACNAGISAHVAKLEADIAEAMKGRGRGIRPKWTANSLALHTQAVLQGAFILAKAKGDAAIAGDSIDHLRRYIELLFRPAKRKGA